MNWKYYYVNTNLGIAEATSHCILLWRSGNILFKRYITTLELACSLFILHCSLLVASFNGIIIATNRTYLYADKYRRKWQLLEIASEITIVNCLIKWNGPLTLPINHRWLTLSYSESFSYSTWIGILWMVWMMTRINVFSIAQLFFHCHLKIFNFWCNLTSCPMVQFKSKHQNSSTNNSKCMWTDSLTKNWNVLCALR